MTKYGDTRFLPNSDDPCNTCLVRRFFLCVLWFKGDSVYLHTEINIYLYKLIKQCKDNPTLTHLHTAGT